MLYEGVWSGIFIQFKRRFFSEFSKREFLKLCDDKKAMQQLSPNL
ncbi:hypothetical protein PU02_0389 [Bartonella ancashensis]|uniref:Uncharacterized protein n=1 Tax=Bartonella ancashensis TaxID=1318743 RepID=A0A0M5KSE6_9HYPH|nr:hypothetical protein PU02_0389 [Bartonella ancashensis]